MPVPFRGASMVTQEHSAKRVLQDGETEHQGREALDDEQEVRPHPAAPWADFMRTVCAGCPLC